MNTSHDLARVQALDLRALNPRLPDERLVQEGLPVLDHEGLDTFRWLGSEGEAISQEVHRRLNLPTFAGISTERHASRVYLAVLGDLRLDRPGGPQTSI